MSFISKFSQIKQFLEVDLWKVKLSALNSKRRFLYRNLRIFIISLVEFDRNSISEKASGLTYFSLLSIVPLLSIAFGVAKGFGLEKYLERELNNIFFGQKEILEMSLEFTKRMLDTVNGGVIIGFSLVFILYAVLRLLYSVEWTFNEIWHTKSRSWQRKVSDYLAMVLLAPLLLILSGSVTVYITSEVKSLAELEVLGLIRPFILFTIKLIPYAIVSLLLTLVYIILPNIKVKFIPAAVSGILMGILFQFTQLAWINGQSFLSNYSVVYGTLVILPLFMIYLQISWTLVLFGAEYAYARQHVDTWKFRYESMQMSPNHKRKLVLLIFYHMIENFKSEEKKPLSVSNISALVDVPYRFIHDICLELEHCELISQLQDDDAIRYQPALDINQIDMHLVMTKLDANGYEGFKINEDQKLVEIEHLMHALDSAIKNSKANLYLKDL